MEPGASTNGQQTAQGLPPIAIPDHELVRRIGSGSYGEVWLARNVMGMYRAVKIIYRASFASERPFERELSGIRKFEPISRSHEGFVDVLHVGRDPAQHCFYYIMELGDDEVAGQDIDAERYSPKTLAKEISQRGKLGLNECVQLGLALTRALTELHKSGLVHRDIKPSNIIFVNGVPKLADIGLVAEVNAAPSYVGTEGFIPPEGPGKPPADMYGLGKVLYEASTGKDRLYFPEFPAWWRESSEHAGLLELNEVMIRACENVLTRRYPSAWDMQADLLVIANGRSVKRLKVLERRWANLKRAAGIAALVLTILGAISYSVYRERQRAVEARQRQVGSDVAYGNAAMNSGDLLGALPYFADALGLVQGDRVTEESYRLRFGSVLAQCPRLSQVWLEGKYLSDGQFSPDGQRVLLAENGGRARILDVQTGRFHSHAFDQLAGSSSAAYSPDGRFIVTASADQMARVWGTANLEPIRALPHPDKIYRVRFSPDGSRIVTACKDGSARVWEAQTGRLIRTLNRHAGPVMFAAFSHDGRLIVTTGQDGSARLWTAEDGQPFGRPFHHVTWVIYAAFSPDDKRLLTACEDHKARVWEVSAGRQILPDLAHRDVVASAEFSPDGQVIVTASFDGTVRLWDANTLQPLHPNPILRHGERVTHAAFSPEGHRILAACMDGSVRIWDFAGSTKCPMQVDRSYSGDASRFLTVSDNVSQVWDAVTEVAVSHFITLGALREEVTLNRNGRFVLRIRAMQLGSGATNHLLEVWDAETGHALAPGVLLTNALEGATLSDDGARLVTFSGPRAQAWNVLIQEPLSSPLVHPEPVGSAIFSPDGNRIAMRSGNRVHVWDTTSGHPAFPPLEHPVPVKYLEFSPNGSLLVTCCADPLLTKCYAQVWNAVTGQPVGPQLRHGDGVLRATFSPDSRWVATASEDFTAIVWDALTGKQLTLALQHDHQVGQAAFSHHAKWIVTASADGTARVWSAETGDALTPPLRHLAKPAEARFLPDDRRILTADKHGHTWIWELPVDQRPVEDMNLLAHFLAGDTIDSLRRLTGRPQESLQSLWQRLRTHYPSDFSTSADEIVAWHAFEAEDSQLREQWSAAGFHLERLLALRPADPSLAERLARAKAHLKDED
jgi:WD40 repeat protein